MSELGWWLMPIKIEAGFFFKLEFRLSYKLRPVSKTMPSNIIIKTEINSKHLLLVEFNRLKKGSSSFYIMLAFSF